MLKEGAWLDLQNEYPVGPGLSPFLASVEKGDDLDIRTPLWKGKTREEILSLWDDIYVNSPERPERLDQIESAQRSKVGPLSIRAPLSVRIPQIQEYWSGFDDSVPQELMNYERLNEIFKPTFRRLRPLTVDHADAELAGNTNSGFPYFTKKRKVREEAKALANRPDSLRKLPAILGWRGQSGGEHESDVKQRTVWMYPFSTNIMEMRYFRPCQDILLRPKVHPLASWIGPDYTDAAVGMLMKSAQARGVAIISTDFDSFDQSIGPALSSPAYEFIANLCQRDCEGEVRELWEMMHHIGLIISSNTMYNGTHGVSSGSVFTNMVDSLVHLNCSHFVSRLMGCEIVSQQVQGDDGLIVLSEECDIEDLTDGYSLCGLTANPDKQFLGYTDCTYLQKYYTMQWEEGGKGIYPSYRALNSLMGQERFYADREWGADMVTLRSIMILENAKNHPLFRELVQFAMDGDIYRLGARWRGGIDGLLFGTNVISRAKSLAGFIPVYNKERDVDGIRSFSTYKLIKEIGG